jgi:hypothetical protein
MSAKLDLYDNIKARITELVPEIKTVRLFNNQFEKEKTENAFDYPCLFVEFMSLPWETKSKGLQEAAAVIRLHLGFESLETEEREIFSLAEKVHQNIQKHSAADLFTNLTRINEMPDGDHDAVIVWLIDYSTLLYDTSGHITKKLVPAKIDDLEITVDPDGPYLKQIHS